MSTSFNIFEAKAKFSHLITLAMAGEQVEICKRGVPVAALGPIPSPKKRKRRELGCFRGQVEMLPGFDEPDYTEEELDAMIHGLTYHPPKEES